jgi:hypothetical protein
VFGASALALAAAFSRAEAATTVGTITACYYSAECTYADINGLTGTVDGPAFLFTNTGTSAITGASFAIAASKKLNIKADSYRIGTIAAGKSAVIVVGASNDKKTRPAGLFFYYNGPTDPTDTSDNGVDADTIVFTFKGKIGTTAVTSGKIVTGASAGPSADGSVAKLNFLGGPGNADGPCNDCFAPKVIANITTVTTAATPIVLGADLAR